MQLTLERPDHEFSLRGADGTAAMVNTRSAQRRLVSSFIVSPDRLIEDWPASDAGFLSPEDLAPLFSLQPEVILLGSGAIQVFPPASAMAACLRLGIGLEVMTNAAAARTFNVLASENRRVVAGFLFAT